ncbi:MAG: EAL domain-containing protein [Leptospirales bacterium]
MKKRAIVIDDDDVSLSIIGAVLKSMKYPYDTFSDPVKAWEKIQKTHYSIYIVDWRMPGMDGLTLTGKIRDIYHEYAVILMLSGTEDNKEIDIAISRGVDDYQIKPVGVEQLRRRIKILDTRAQALEERMAIQSRLRDSQTHFKAIFDNSAVGVMVMSLSGVIIEHNTTLNKMVGKLEIKVQGNFVPDFIHPDDKNKIENFFHYFLEKNQSKARYNTKLVSRSGSPVWARLSVSKVPGSADNEGFIIVIVEDITDQKLYEQQLHYDALHDSMTGLPNRELFLDRVHTALNRWETTDNQKHEVLFSVLILDIDRFQIINESLGHELGDELINMLGKRLRKTIGEADTLARLTGDEFGIINERAHTVAEISYYIKTIKKDLERSFEISDHQLKLTASIGVKCYTEGESAVTGEVLRDADTALHRAKDLGVNRFEFFISEMTQESRETLELENDLRKAIDNGELELYFQPQVDLNIERITGVEALIRWNHPVRGLLLPGKFIPLAEKTGQIIDIGEWVMETAMEKMASWSALGYKPLYMAINFAATQFHEGSLLKKIKEIQRRFPCHDNKLKIEITESILLENREKAVATLMDLQDLGILLALDDFGTGYSSLTYLKNLPIDFIKIDQSFIRNIVHSESDRSIVMAIIAMSHSLKKKAIGEGVENKDQMNMLASMYCDMVQGYYISRPMPEEKLFKYFDEKLNKSFTYE